MPDREKYIKVLSKTVKTVKEFNEDAPIKISLECVEDILELLKEQEKREKRICKSICDFIRGACSTDTDDDKNFVCHEIQKYFTEGREVNDSD